MTCLLCHRALDEGIAHEECMNEYNQQITKWEASMKLLEELKKAAETLLETNTKFPHFDTVKMDEKTTHGFLKTLDLNSAGDSAGLISIFGCRIYIDETLPPNTAQIYSGGKLVATVEVNE